MEAHQLAGLARERVGRGHVHHDVEQAADRDREREYEREQTDPAGNRLHHEQTPQPASERRNVGPRPSDR